MHRWVGANSPMREAPCTLVCMQPCCPQGDISLFPEYFPSDALMAELVEEGVEQVFVRRSGVAWGSFEPWRASTWACTRSMCLG